ncbi:MAG: SLBB domain-containing protein [Coraliomargarita sp.]
MKTLHFTTCRKTTLLLSLLFCNALSAKEPQSYDWAYQLREEVQQVPHYTEFATKPTTPAVEAVEANSDEWPWGTPKNLLSPIREDKPTRPNNERRSVNRLRSGGPSNNSSNTSITVNIGPEGEAQPSVTDKVTERSRLEELYSGDFDRQASRELEQFGYAVFSPDSINLHSTGPTPASYIIGAGDQILITLSGAVEAFHQLTVDHDGILSIPEFGTLRVAGTTYGNLHAQLLAFLNQRRHSFELTVSIGQRRAIQVNVVGRVANPGRIEVPALSNLIVTLSAAGGVNKDGSLRKIVLNRTSSNGDTQTVIDLYDYLRSPDQNTAFPQLQEQDTLYVPAIGTTVGVAGYVQAPGIYELKQAHFTVADALEIAGGLTPFSFTPLAQIERTIDGRVRFPGEYIFPDGAQITDLIKAAGGILEDADLRAGVFTRESTRKLQQSRLDNLIERTRRLAEGSLERMVQTGRSKEGLAAKIALEQTKDLLSRMSNENANGRIVIPFEAADFPASAYNLPLQSGDSLSIPRSHSTVSVSGDVFRPITFVVTEGISVEDALEKAGGLTEMAEEDLIYVIRANGEIERSKKSKGFIKKHTKLYAGDVLLAPTQPMKRTFAAQFGDLVMLTRQLAEIAVITANGDKEFDVSLVSPFTPEQSGLDANVNAAVFLD